MKRIIRPTKVLVASGVVAVALLAACGGGDSGQAPSTAAHERVDAAATARLEAQAEQHERSAHLQGQARTYRAPAERPDAVRPNPIETANRAVAEQLERSAHVEGQARTHSKAASSDDAPVPADDTSDDEFVPGSRHMPMGAIAPTHAPAQDRSSLRARSPNRSDLSPGPGADQGAER
jgi:hypothetical protein